VGDIETLVVDLMAQRWSKLFLNTTDFYLSIATDQVSQMLDQPRRTITFWTSSTGITHHGKLISMSMLIKAALRKLSQFFLIRMPRKLASWFILKAFLADTHSFPRMQLPGEQCALRQVSTTSREKLDRHMRL
jgi:hypothetical protein